MKKTKLKVLAFFLSAVVLPFPLEITALTEITASSESAVLSDEYESGIMPMSAISTYDVGRTYRLRNRGSGMYLDVRGNGTAEGTAIQQFPEGDYLSLRWTLRFDPMGYYIFESNLGSGSDMVIKSSLNGAVGTDVVLSYKEGSSPRQSWSLQKLSNGAYKIISARNSSACLAVHEASTLQNAGIVLASIRNGAAEQEWYIEETDPIVGQRYCLRNRGSGMYLDISGNGTTNGTPVQQYPKGEYPSEHWMISHDSGGMYVLHTDLVSSGIYSSGDMVLDGRANCVAGAQVIIYNWAYATEQTWRIKRQENGTYKLSPARNLNLALSIENSSTSSNARVVLASIGNSAFQEWYLEPVPEQIFKFRNKANGLYMTVESSLNVSGQQIKLKEEYQSSNSQQFRLVYNSSGRYYTASPTCSYNGYGIVLDVCGGIGNGNRVWTYTNNGASEERLVFYAVPEYHSNTDPDSAYKISFRDNPGYVMDYSGENVVLKPDTGAESQQWYIEYDYDYNRAEEYYQSLGFSWPVGPKSVSSAYGYRDLGSYSFHSAIDIPAPNRTALYSASSGRCVKNNYDSFFGCGYYAVIETDAYVYNSNTKLRILYQHLADYVSNTNSNLNSTTYQISKGELIGRTGDSGSPGSYHLHMALITDGSDVFIGNNQYSTRYAWNTFDPLALYCVNDIGLTFIQY